MQRVLSILLLSSVPACGLFDDTSSPPQQPPPNNGGGNGGGGGGGGGGGEEERGVLPLNFSGVQPVNGDFPNQSNVNNHIAVGGTHEVTLELDSDLSELAVAFDATTLSLGLSIDEIDGPLITLRANGAGIDDLMITDPATGELFDDALYAMSAFDHAVPVGVVEGITSPQYDVPAASFVFAAGTTEVGVAYLNASVPANRLVDTSATLAGPGTQTRWDVITLDSATVGMHEVAVTVGGVESTVQVEVVDHADVVQELISIFGATCFGAFTHGSFVTGLDWTISIDGTVIDPASGLIFLGPNCVLYDGATPHQITATAGGQTLTITSP